MNDEVKRFFDSINFIYDEEIFACVSVKKVVLNKVSETFKVYLVSDFILPYEETKKLYEAEKNGINGKPCKIYLEYLSFTDEDVLSYVNILLENLIAKKPSLMGIKENEVIVTDKKILIEVSSKIEQLELEEYTDKLLSKLESYGFSGLKIEISIDEEKNKLVKEEIESSKNNDIVFAEKEEVSYVPERKVQNYPVEAINNLIGEVNKVAIEAYVFDMEAVERKGQKGSIFIINLKVSDKTNSILAKIVKFKKEEFDAISKDFKKGKWYRLNGKVEMDRFVHDLVFNITSYEEIPSKDEIITDDEEEKRIELHAHTMMSAMDSVIPYEEKNPRNIVNFAISLGHKAVAITDHNGCQAYPEVFHTVSHYNKGKSDEEKFKVLYGAELNIVNDDIDLIFNDDKEYNLLEDEFVVFDTETTGFYAGSDQMIEIGAVKIKNGEITDRFDELIDPKRPLPKKIIELTFITDEMLAGKPSEEEITKKFLEWIGDAPLIAHNAKFDISFMKAACSKYNLGAFNNTVLDTMSIARSLHSDWPNHKLSTLVKKLNVEWDEDKHHRADYDAEGTAHCFYKMSKELYNQNVETTKDLTKEIDIDKMIRFERPFHATIIAKTREGLSNLYKMISLANTKYLYKNEQPKIPRRLVQELRDGLLIGSGCINGELFINAKTKEDEEVVNMMNFYDYIEVQPIEAMSHLIGPNEQFSSELELQNYIERLINIAKEAGKPVCATSDAHTLTREDKIYREIIIDQRFNGKLHPLSRVNVPEMHFRTTRDMLDQFAFLEESVRKDIVINNPNKLADMCDIIEVIPNTKGIPFSPRIEKSRETTVDLVYTKASSWYGNPLPHNIEERIATELYGDVLFNAIKENNPSDPYEELHNTILKGYDEVLRIVTENIEKHKDEYDEDTYNSKLKKPLGGIIGGGFDVIYLIAQKLVKKSNDDGFLVGSRGSVGSSFVATMMGITEVNPLPAHYRCPKCLKSIFEDNEGKPFGSDYSSGFDLPDKKCPDCGENLLKDGQDMPFATFLGFNADKVPDIDLNFSDLNQGATHAYTKVLFGEDNVYRAGTIGTVAEKTAFGYVKYYCEDKNLSLRNLEVERLAKGCTGVKRTTGQHPGGIVVIPDYKEVFDFTPFQFPAEDPDSAWRTTHFDYHAIDECVLKLDILGHTDPTQLRLIQDITGDDITKVPLDDKETMGIFLSPKPLGVTKEEIMCETGTLGIPEFGTNFTIGLVKETKPTTFGELVKISGLSHGTDVWLGNAQELIKKNIVPFKEVIGCRDDIMVYLMYHGVKPIKAFKIMEFVRKGRASKDPEGWKEHVETMKEAGIEEWYIDSCGKIKYMFPKAHAAAYVISAFRIAWYKVHKPIVYYATYFSCRFTDFDIEVMIKGYDEIKKKMLEIQAKGYEATNKDNSVLETLKLALEMTARGFKFGNLDIQKSDAINFVIDEDNKTLIPPFRTLDGLGDSVANKIIEERNIKPFYSVEDFQLRGKVSATTIEKLRSMGIFEGMPESSQLSLF